MKMMKVMKTILMSSLMTLALLSVAMEAQADCLGEVIAQSAKESKAKGEDYHGAEMKAPVDLADAIRESESLSLHEKKELGKLSSSPDYELYLIAASSQAINYLDIMVVQKHSCAIARSFKVFLD